MLGSYSHTQDFAEHVEKDIRMDNYLKLFFKRKSIRSIVINEDRDVNIQNPYVKLFNHEPSHDLRILVGDQVTYYCHKTILESTSLYFTDLFKSSNWSDFDTDVYKLDVNDEESIIATDYIIRYCYDLQIDIEPSHLIGVMKASHMHNIKPLITLCSKKLEISTDNYFSLIEGLYDYIEDPLFSKLHQNIIEFGVKHCKQLFSQDKKSCRKLPPTTLEEIFTRLASR
ncbi:predicted protein [Naegleria gruberi]|uniref:Predicted protein n=1 Tax=Naegleria gruberi TaxID=5762 RepID=D2VXS1_NAEGR|nr:uncharacterized protein NAEGRDRAFT_53089 [Naegleria gruberi]EFC38341.1 predicted protein [Naegleria gruberi]|eukprot:XP_002671085.1 predicted protein [Naegleria gruberi strain NEG-M]